MASEKSSYTSIAKSSGIIGLVQIVKIVFGLIQNKILALVVGTTGFGIWGMYNTYIEMVSSFASLGLDSSGVRQIAKNCDDEISTAKCIWVFRRSLLLISVVATVISIIFCKVISNSLFQSEDYYWGIIIVSSVIFFNSFSKGNIAILNGLRHIRSLAMSQIIGAVVGAVAAIAAVVSLGVNGIPLFLVVIGGTAAISTWWYVHQLNIKVVKPTSKDIRNELKGLVMMGLGFSVSAAIAALMAYLSRIYLISEFDMSAVGIYSASWTISNLYIGTILTAMGVDFMPRLMRVINDRMAVRKMIGEQLEFGILVSSIGVLAILVFSPLVLKLFYSNEFIIGTSVIRWQVLGVAMRIFGFVFGYVIMAYNKPVVFIITQAFVVILDYILLIVFSNIFGFEGLGVNYFLSYFVYLFVGFIVCNKIVGINMTKGLRIIVLVEWMTIAFLCILIFFLNEFWIVCFGSIVILLYLCWMNYAFKQFMHINALQFILDKIRRK